jgi:MtrB/PioB family decaheme-associated outer membrane protein
VKRFLCTAAALTLLAPATVMAQDGTIQTSGGFQVGVQSVDLSGSSAKFNEYRDIQDGFYLYNLDFEAIDTDRGLYLDFSGRNLIRDDQRLNFGVGSFGLWGVEVERKETPKRISNDARTPYIYQGDGLFTVGSPAPIVVEGTPTLVPSAPEMRGPVGPITTPGGFVPEVLEWEGNDGIVSRWLVDNLRDVQLGTQRKKDSVSLSVSPLDFLRFRLTYSDERKEGTKVTYGPIGDRPPRTLNIQMPEPIDYRTRELKAEADLHFNGIQGRVAYQLSDFNNDINTLTWQNIFFAPDAGQDFATTLQERPLEPTPGPVRRVSEFGQRALDPDNRYHNISGSVGIDLPMDSRLTASAAYGWMKQDMALLPYSYSNFGFDWAVNEEGARGNLPRSTADAEINTMLFNLDYSVNIIDRLNLRPFFRYYKLDNETPSDQWRYVTQDVVGGTGGVNYRNNRINLPYGYDKMNYGLDTRYTMAFWRTTLGLGYEREEIDRDFREADTDENIYKISIRTQPMDQVLVRASYLYGDRKSDGYDSQVTAQSYWYTLGQANNDVDNPAFLFANHPDLRKFDVSDRERNQFDISAVATPLQALDVGANYSYRKDDFDSGVRPSQPLANVPQVEGLINEADRFAFTPGLQLGLLEEKRQNYGIDAYYAPVQRWHVSAFANREEIDSHIRGSVFNENQRRSPSSAGRTPAPALLPDDPRSLGPWAGFTGNEAGEITGVFEPTLGPYNRLFETRMDDRTNTVGLGGGYEIIPGRIKLSTDYIVSRGKVGWDYSGYGTDFPEGPRAAVEWQTQDFGFRSPPTVRNNQYTLSAALEYQLVEGLVFGLHYLFDRFRMQDWMLEGEGEWVERGTIAGEYMLRDTSRDNRWGNRLVNMGSPLWGSYEAHVGYVTMTYRF